MTWFLPAIEKAIGDRLVADTGTGGLFDATALLLAVHPGGATIGSGIYNTYIPATTVVGSSVFPAIIFEVKQATRENESLRTATMRLTVEFAVIVDRDPGVYNPLKRGTDIMDRMQGDWTEQAAGTAPTYGLDRWKPTLAGTSWLPDVFLHDRYSTAHEADRFVWLSEFNVNVSRQGV